MTAHLTDEEIAAICRPLVQHAAQARRSGRADAMARVRIQLPPLVEPIPAGEAVEMDDEQAAAFLLTEFGCLDGVETEPMGLDGVGDA